ncbi:restriction endonuclease subunit S [Lysinibacillus sp. NPDC093692]|uniref:restriction endonuclease subunit S n=1 Tax=Lysinibacillus sp. NPDC093692 TaxID=3390578 RepID=UPI003D0882EA
MVKCYRLDEVATIEEGKIIPSKKYFTNIGVPLITADNLKKLMLDGDIEQLPKVNITFGKHCKCVPVPAKTIILTKANLKDTNKYIYQSETELCIASEIVAIIPNETIVLSDYLLHFLRWYKMNKEWQHLYHIPINLPMIDIQHKIVQTLNTIQLLLKSKEPLLTAVEGLPQHFDNVSVQVEHHSKSLHYGFQQAQYLYNHMLYKIFKGEHK